MKKSIALLCALTLLFSLGAVVAMAWEVNFTEEPGYTIPSGAQTSFGNGYNSEAYPVDGVPAGSVPIPVNTNGKVFKFWSYTDNEDFDFAASRTDNYSGNTYDLTAVFFPLVVKSSDKTMGTACGTYNSANDTISIEALPSDGYKFVRWDISVSGSDETPVWFLAPEMMNWEHNKTQQEFGIVNPDAILSDLGE